ncbi:hypothetical protein Goe25_01790 [Bacillus phage vB_BsuM-Goe25]|nr:hypothetical protein Goe25_01790 [Bacillus phage vB_BsuM-Goe25]
MGSILLAMGGVAVVCSAGTGLAAAMKWFHSYEPDVSNKKSSRTTSSRDNRSSSRNRMDELSKKIRTDNHL